MIKTASIFLFLLILLSCSEDETEATTPVVQIEFNNELQLLKTFGGTQEDDALSVVETLDGNIAVLGFTQSNDGDVIGKLTTDSDYWLLKLDLNFNIIWQKTFGGTSDDRGQDIVATNDNGFLITGYSRSSDGDVGENFGFHDFWAMKLNSSGEVLWEQSFGFSGNDRSFSAIQTVDGGYFISGFLDVSASGGEGNDNGTSGKFKSGSTRHGVGEFWGVKLNPEGEIEWRRYYGGSNNDRSYDAIQANDGNIIMAGSSESEDFDVTNPQGSYDFWAVKVNPEGDMIWQKNFGGSSIDIGYSITTTLDNQYLFAGDARSNDGDVKDFKGNTDFWLVKFNENGNMTWQSTYGGSDFESARSVLQLNSGDILIAGSTRSSDGQVSENRGQNDIWIALTEESGVFKKGLGIGGEKIDLANDALQLQNGEVIVVGSSESSDNDIIENKGDKDILIIKLR
jgi:hypothetical protein